MGARRGNIPHLHKSHAPTRLACPQYIYVAPSKGTVAPGGSAMPCHAYMLITYHPAVG
jgi:hypothetical protein